MDGVEEWVGKGGDFLRDYMIISKTIKFASRFNVYKNHCVISQNTLKKKKKNADSDPGDFDLTLTFCISNKVMS